MIIIKKILIAIPSSSSSVNIDCVQSIYHMHIPNNVEVDIHFIQGYSCAQARNKAVSKAIDGGYNYILFLDNDQIIPMNALKRLLNHDKDIIAGYSMMGVGDKRTNASFYVKGDPFGHYDFYTSEWLITGNNEPCIKLVDAIGFSCILIKTSVFNDLPYPYFKYVEYKNKSVLSEDLYFCDSVSNKRGFKIYCDTCLHIGHQKTIII